MVHTEPLQTPALETWGPLFSALINTDRNNCASLCMQCQLLTKTEWLNDLLKAIRHTDVMFKKIVQTWNNFVPDIVQALKDII